MSEISTWPEKHKSQEEKRINIGLLSDYQIIRIDLLFTAFIINKALLRTLRRFNDVLRDTSVLTRGFLSTPSDTKIIAEMFCS